MPASSVLQATEDWPTKQVVESAVADDAVVDARPEAEPEQPLPVTKASVEGDVVLVAAVQRKDDQVDAEPALAGAAPLSRVEELRQMFDQKAPGAEEETTVGEIAGVVENEDGLRAGEGNAVHETTFAAEQLPTTPAAGGDNPVVPMPLSPAAGPRDDEQPGAVVEEGVLVGGGDAVAGFVVQRTKPSVVEEQLSGMATAHQSPIAMDGDVMQVSAVKSLRALKLGETKCGKMLCSHVALLRFHLPFACFSNPDFDFSSRLAALPIP